MAVISDLVSRVRMELGDLPKEFSATVTGDGVKKNFDTCITINTLTGMASLFHHFLAARLDGCPQ